VSEGERDADRGEEGDVTFSPLGVRALRFVIPRDVERRALLERLREGAGIEDVILAEETGAVLHGGGEDDARRARAAAAAAIRTCREAQADTPGGSARATTGGRSHLIEVIYDGEDLEAVATGLGVTTDDVVALHGAAEQVVSMVGFLPGFAYLRGGAPELALPRRAAPRARVPRGSVAVAAGYTGVYPFASPGGWHLLGRAPRFVPLGPDGATLGIGDRVRFVGVSAGADLARDSTHQGRSPRSAGRDDDTARRAGMPGPSTLRIDRARGPALVVDGGRRGHMHEGVPRGGPLVVADLARANRAAGNPPGAAAIELHGELSVVAVGEAITLATQASGPIVLAPGETFVVAPEARRRVAYLAVRGGLDVPRVLGGRGTLLVAGIGGLGGRLLRKGDLLPILGPDAAFAGDASTEACHQDLADETASSTDEAIEVVPGPDASDLDAVVASLLSTAHRVSATSDRTGTRLEGPSSGARGADTTRASTPMVAGAIQMTPSGPIVLGPDHPTTGGYPVPLVVTPRSLDALLSRAPGASVRFALRVAGAAR